jgi:HEAT repeat protein
MIDHRARRLRIILTTVAFLLGPASFGLAQVDVDRELARASDEWKLGTPTDRARALARLECLAEDASPAVPILIAALRASDPPIRIKATRISLSDRPLGEIGDPRDDRVTERPGIPCPRVRGPGPRHFEDLARERRDATRTALRLALGDRDERVRSGASEAIKTLGGDAVPVLVSAIEDSSPAIRIGAARTLGAMGDDARDALGPLRERRNDPDPDVRDAVDSAIRAIAGIDPVKP